MSEWQPIETAPKDGTEILVAVPVPGDVDVCVAYWTGRAWWSAKWRDECLDREALKFGVGGFDYRAFACAPTHWQPKPEPPAKPPSPLPP